MKTPKIILLTLTAVLLLAGLAACGPAPVPTATPTIPPTAVPSATPTVPPAPVAAMDAQRALKVGEMDRAYFLHIPAGLNNQQLVPLVFVFHGFSESGLQARIYTSLDNIANANGFIVVYPNGSGSSGGFSWNGSGCCGYALENNVDDAAFVRAILADVGTMAQVDPKRIYAAGFSNGALLSYRLACTMSDMFAAVAPAGGVLMYSPCEPKQPVSVIHVHGMKDPVVPFEGGGSGIQFPPVKDSLSTWAKLDGCSGAEQVEKNGIVTHTTYGDCAPGVSVQLYAVDGIGHTWPSQYILPISQIVWDFFAAHPKP
jgi:polyhydroxybutyrate depolymerase